MLHPELACFERSGLLTCSILHAGPDLAAEAAGAAAGNAAMPEASAAPKAAPSNHNTLKRTAEEAGLDLEHSTSARAEQDPIASASVSAAAQPQTEQPAQGSSMGTAARAEPSAAGERLPGQPTAQALQGAQAGQAEPQQGSGAARQQALQAGGAADIAAGALAERLRGMAYRSVAAQGSAADVGQDGSAGALQTLGASEPAQSASAAPDSSAAIASRQENGMDAEQGNSQEAAAGDSTSAGAAEGSRQPEQSQPTAGAYQGSFLLSQQSTALHTLGWLPLAWVVFKVESSHAVWACSMMLTSTSLICTDPEEKGKQRAEEMQPAAPPVKTPEDELREEGVRAARDRVNAWMRLRLEALLLLETVLAEAEGRALGPHLAAVEEDLRQVRARL